MAKNVATLTQLHYNDGRLNEWACARSVLSWPYANEIEEGVTVVDTVAELIEPTLNDMGFELVRVQMQGGGRRVLQVMAEPLDREAEMTVDDCADISRAVSTLLDVADPIEGAYHLEVSSPGLDRPLVKPSDFDRFAGFVARIEVDPALDDRKRWLGTLKGIRGGGQSNGVDVLMEVDGTIVELPFRQVKKAKLVITDELIRAAQKQAEMRTRLGQAGI